MTPTKGTRVARAEIETEFLNCSSYPLPSSVVTKQPLEYLVLIFCALQLLHTGSLAGAKLCRYTTSTDGLDVKFGGSLSKTSV